MMGITTKQRKLVQGKVKGLTHKEAYLKAGYSPNMSDQSIMSNVDRTLRKALVKEYYDELQKEVVTTAEKETIASAQEIQELLTKLARDEEEDKVSNKDRIRALELLGKAHAIFTEKQEVTADVKINPILASISNQLEGDDEDETI